MFDTLHKVSSVLYRALSIEPPDRFSLPRAVLPGLYLVLIGMVVSENAQGSEGKNAWIGSNSFGGAGLLQTRTARSRADGHFEVGYSIVDPYKRYYITLQGLPWLEGTFRYTEIRNQLYSPFASFSGTQTFKDRGADITFKLLEETKYTPAIALTLQDGLGTGQYAGEYLSFSKGYYDLDFSGGIAWGYGASGGTFDNPLALLSEKFEQRTTGARTGGDIKIDTYFSGQKIAFYGGLAYRTPIDGLVLKFEYDPNDFQNEPSNSTLQINNHFNYALNYKPFDWMETSIGVERGYQLSFRMTLKANLHDPGIPKFDPPPPALTSRKQVQKDLENPTIPEQEWPLWRWPGDNQVADDTPDSKNEESRNGAIERLFQIFESAGLSISEIELGVGTSRFVVNSPLPDKEQKEITDIVEIVASVAPDSSEVITIAGAGIGEATISLDRREIEGDKQIVDHLFDEFEARGLQILDIQFSDEKVEMSLSQSMPGAVPDSRTAEIVFNSLPTPVESLVVHILNAGQQVESFEFYRENSRNEALVDELFEIVDTEGLEITSIDVTQRAAEIRVLAIEGGGKPGLVRTARLLASVAPMELDDVTVVAARAGTEIARVHVRRSEPGISSGSEWGLVDVDGKPVIVVKAPEWSEEDRMAISSQLFSELSKEGFSAEAMSMEGYRVTVYGSSRKYRSPARNIGRAIRAVANNVPPEIEEISIITLAAGMELNRLTINRQEFEKAVNGKGGAEEIWANAIFENGKSDYFLPDNVVKNKNRYPSMNWLFNPKFRTHMGGPSRFLLYQLYLTAGFDAQFLPGLSMTGRLRRNIYNNFERIRFGSSSVLPHVRTDVKEYLQESKDFSIDRVQADYFFKPVDDWFGRASAGIFEEMFGGYSMEVLHRPFKSRFAVGVDINRVWQREYDQRFRFKEYVVNTGHLNLYYELPWKNISASAHIGQYLAGDRGITFKGSREFDGGVIFGLWSTFTDVSAEDFGEGSFDKGFYVRIPFDLFLTKSTTQRGTFGFRPITRDGGARLGMQSALYGIVTQNNVNKLVHHWDGLLD
jgi:hypothetical protein